METVAALKHVFQFANCSYGKYFYRHSRSGHWSDPELLPWRGADMPRIGNQIMVLESRD